MLLLIRAAHAHISHLVLDTFYNALHEISEPRLTKVLTDLCHLLALAQLFPQMPGSNASTVTLPPQLACEEAAAAAERETNCLLAALEPNAIALTDSWNFGDASLASDIFCARGNVYERLLS